MNKKLCKSLLEHIRKSGFGIWLLMMPEVKFYSGLSRKQEYLVYFQALSRRNLRGTHKLTSA